MYYRLSLYSLFVASTVCLSGCGGTTVAESLPDTAPVSGVITLNGKPITSATVTFVPMGSTEGVEGVGDRKSRCLNSSHCTGYRMPPSY